MKKTSSKKQNMTIYLIVLLAVTTISLYLFSTFLMTKKEQAPIPNQDQQPQVVDGILVDATMHTLILDCGELGQLTFDKTDAEIHTSQQGLLIGNEVQVHYFGDLAENETTQSVEVVEIFVNNTIEAPDALSTTHQKALNILNEMSLPEKVGQMFIVRSPESIGIDSISMIQQYHLGGLILFADDFNNKTVDQVQQDLADYQKASDIPLFIGVDEEGGSINRISKFKQYRDTPFRSPQELYREGGMELIVQDTQEKADFLKNLGINLNFAPVADVSNNPDDYIYSRTLGQNETETGEFVAQVVTTMNEKQLGSVLKHFPGYGNNKDTHTGIAIDQRTLEQFIDHDFIPFQRGIEAEATMILVSHNIVECIDAARPASLSAPMHQLLREQLNYQGILITDDLYMNGIRDFVEAEQAAVEAVLAGNDLLCCTDFEAQVPAVLKAVQEGVIDEERINTSVLRILEAKIKLGLLP